MRKIIPAHLNSFITLQDLGDGGDDTNFGTACRCRYKEGCPNPIETAPSIFTKYFKTIYFSRYNVLSSVHGRDQQTLSL